MSTSLVLLSFLIYHRLTNGTMNAKKAALGVCSIKNEHLVVNIYLRLFLDSISIKIEGKRSSLNIFMKLTDDDYHVCPYVYRCCQLRATS